MLGYDGLTISHWNGRSNFPLLAKIGVRFVIAKASESTDYRDDTYLMNYNEFRAVHVNFGAYHFWRDQSGPAQADNFLRSISGTKPEVWMIDVEENYKDPRGVLNRIREFIKIVQAELKLWPIWYSSPGYMKQFELAGIEDMAALPLMVAEWNKRLPMPVYPWFVPMMYQVWADQKIPGLNIAAEHVTCLSTWAQIVVKCRQPHLLEG